MSSEESLSETAVSEWHEGNSSGSDEDLPNRENLCVRPLSWQSIEVNGLMAQLDRKVAWCQSQWSENNGNRAHSETSIKPRSTRWCSWVCSGTHHLRRKRNLIISITQIIFWRTFRKEEDILDKNVQNNNNTQVDVDVHHDSVPFQLSSSNHIYSIDNCTIFWVLIKTYNVVSQYPLTPIGRSYVKTRYRL